MCPHGRRNLGGKTRGVVFLGGNGTSTSVVAPPAVSAARGHFQYHHYTIRRGRNPSHPRPLFPATAFTTATGAACSSAATHLSAMSPLR